MVIVRRRIVVSLPVDGRIWELPRAALLIKREPSSLDPDVLSELGRIAKRNGNCP
ncbi:hypothetical protein DPMN_032856 [Dreissena polymorpha]|uniref:Uncharacterized protein n=1 Tax=Dreissena polymorpha TaxID=45954 RepID=A0A9D4RIC9_DREPO|nr:hypothetical protein DPMN_032856 [Dreissena polymorpha]